MNISVSKLIVGLLLIGCIGFLIGFELGLEEFVKVKEDVEAWRGLAETYKEQAEECVCNNGYSDYDKQRIRFYERHTSEPLFSCVSQIRTWVNYTGEYCMVDESLPTLNKVNWLDKIPEDYKEYWEDLV